GRPITGSDAGSPVPAESTVTPWATPRRQTGRQGHLRSWLGDGPVTVFCFDVSDTLPKSATEPYQALWAVPAVPGAAWTRRQAGYTPSLCAALDPVMTRDTVPPQANKLTTSY